MTCMKWTNIWQPAVHVQQNVFWRIIVKDCNAHLHASFGTFCVQIGRLFEAQWVFEKYLEIDKLPFSMENVVDFESLRIFTDALCFE